MKNQSVLVVEVVETEVGVTKGIFLSDHLIRYQHWLIEVILKLSQEWENKDYQYKYSDGKISGWKRGLRIMICNSLKDYCKKLGLEIFSISEEEVRLMVENIFSQLEMEFRSQGKIK